MTTTESPSSNVTHAELVTNVRYGYWFNHMCERVYAHLDFGLNVVQLVGGSGAAYGALQGEPKWTVLTGMALALAAAFSLLVQPSVKAERHRRAKCEYLALEARAWKISADELSEALMRVRADAPTGLQSLTVPAFNATLNAIGATVGHLKEGWMHRIFKALA